MENSMIKKIIETICWPWTKFVKWLADGLPKRKKWRSVKIVVVIGIVMAKNTAISMGSVIVMIVIAEKNVKYVSRSK